MGIMMSLWCREERCGYFSMLTFGDGMYVQREVRAYARCGVFTDVRSPSRTWA